jgi:anti-anti-sigma factor
MLVANKISFDFDERLLIVRFLHASLTERAEIDRIGKEIIRRMSPMQAAVVLDCSTLTSHVSSPFLGMLVHLHKTAVDRGVKLVVCGLNDHLQEVVRVAKLDKVVTIYSTAEEAIGKLTAPRRNPIKQLYHGFRESQQKSAWVAVVVIPLVLIAAFVVWMNWKPSEDGGPAGYGTGSLKRFSSRASINGRVAYTSRGVELADDGTLVMSWPVKYQPRSRYEARRLLASPITQADQLFAVTVASNGNYRFEVGFDREQEDFHVLIISDHVRRSEPLLPHDRELLAEIVDDVDQLLRKQQYCIRRHTLRANESTAVSWVFQRE